MAPHADETPDTPSTAPVDNILSKQKQNEEGGSGSRLRSNRGEPDAVSPMMLGSTKDVEDFSLDRSPRQFSAKVGKRLSGRLSYPSSPSWLAMSTELKSPELLQKLPEAQMQDQYEQFQPGLGDLFMQIAGWLQEEKQRFTAHKARKKDGTIQKTEALDFKDGATASLPASSRRPSDASEHYPSLEKLERIIEKGIQLISSARTVHRPASLVQRPSSIRKLRRRSTVGSSDAENQDLYELVPSCEAILDNSKTMSHYGGAVDMNSSTDLARSWTRDNDEWHKFKFEIVRLTHTLRLKRWRMVPMDRSRDVEVERLTGALTNAVYVVSPPKDLPSQHDEEDDEAKDHVPRKPPPKLLLRVYGVQTEHVIDREVELQILRRLARKNIGPRMLGTFTNGRFEQFFNARTLKPQDLRVAETSKQIAKRMRELHEGIELLEKERDGGPFVWKNWDKWLDRCEQVASYMDKLAKRYTGARHVCGVEWPVFRRTVEAYRKWLDEQYGGQDSLKEQLVFSHNDTQYGNILRLLPSGESPLLLPANEHKQLVVIDFEYANANTPGFEFANHFTEWCYNYHDPARPFACNTQHYPTPDEQHRFLKAYVQHRPTFTQQSGPTPGASPSILPMHQNATATTPTMTSQPPTPHARPLHSQHSTSSLRSFMLDSRTPREQQRADEDAAEAEAEAEVRRLMHETRLWRIACSAQWVAWGLLQARVEGLDKADGGGNDGARPASVGIDGVADPLDKAGKALASDQYDKRPCDGDGGGDVVRGSDVSSGEDEFDYLAYARDRALFFWGDVLQLAVPGLVRDGELPRELIEAAKQVVYSV